MPSAWTLKYCDTHRHMHTQTHRYLFYILHLLTHLAYMPGIEILYLAYHRLTHAQTLRHAHTHTHTHTHIYIYRDIDRWRYTETHACLYTNTTTQTDLHVGNYFKSILSQNCYFKHGNWGNCYFKAILKLQLAKIVILNGKSQEIITWNAL